MPPPSEKKPDSVNSGIDISKILLPKKETGPTPESASRINAGALLAQEQSATLLAPEAPSSAPAPAAPPPAPEASTTHPLQTYKSDMEKVVKDQSVSVVSIAAAEAERRGKQPLQPKTAEEKATITRSWVMIAGSAALLLLAGAVLAFVFLRPTTAPTAQAPMAPFIAVDGSALISVPADQRTRGEVMANLQATLQKTKLSLGLIAWLYVAEPSATEGGALRPLGASEMLGIFSPDIPEELLRTLEPTYLIGVHSFDENQPFMLLQVESYETAYAGMLEWERTMQRDLSPLFNRNPSPTQNGTPVPTSTPQFLETNFVDKIVENRDVRAILNAQGDLLLLWTFLGRSVIVITTNEYTLREVLSRLNTTPVVPALGQ